MRSRFQKEEETENVSKPIQHLRHMRRRKLTIDTMEEGALDWPILVRVALNGMLQVERGLWRHGSSVVHSENWGVWK